MHGPVGVDIGRAGARFDQRREGDVRWQVRHDEGAGRPEIHRPRQVGRNQIILVHVPGRGGDKQRVGLFLDAPVTDIYRHRQGARSIRDRVMRHGDAPRLAQLAQTGMRFRVRHVEQALADSRLRGGIDEENRPALAQHELVDQPFLPVRQGRGVRHKQHVQVGGQRLEIVGDRNDLERPVDVCQQCVAALSAGRRHAGQRGEDAHARRIGIVQPRDHAGEIIFQRNLAFRRQERDHTLIVDRVVADDAEIERVVAICVDGGNPGGERFVFSRGEGGRVDLPHADSAARLGLIRLQQFPHAGGIGPHGRIILRDAARIDERHVHRFGNVRQLLPRRL